MPGFSPRPWQLLPLFIGIAALGWVADRAATARAEQAVARAVGAATEAARVGVLSGPIEVRDNRVWVSGAPLTHVPMPGVAITLSADASACGAENSERTVLGARERVQGIVWDGAVRVVERCEPLVGISGDVVGLLSARAPVQEWAGSPVPQRVALAVPLLALFGLVAGLGVLLGRALSRAQGARDGLISERSHAVDAAVQVREGTAALLAAEAAALSAKTETAAAHRAKRDFLVGLNRELRVPVGVIVAQTRALAGEVRPDLRDEVQRVADATLALSVSLQDALDVAEIEAGSLELQPTTFSVRELLEVLARDAAEAVALGGNRLEVEVDERIGELTADRDRVRQILANLLSNAAKFTDDGQITVTAVPLGDMVRFSVADTGIGLTEAQVVAIFAPFHRAPKQGRRVDGIGMGLPLVRLLAEKMGGSVSVASEPGAGSQFSVVLPRSPV